MKIRISTAVVAAVMLTAGLAGSAPATAATGYGFLASTTAGVCAAAPLAGGRVFNGGCDGYRHVRLAEQEWQVRWQRVVSESGKCLTDWHGPRAARCKSTNRQRWSFVRRSGYDSVALRDKATGRCLTFVPGDAYLAMRRCYPYLSPGWALQEWFLPRR